MRRTALTMAQNMRIGQIITGRAGVSYRLQQILYERKRLKAQNQEIVYRLWLADSNNQRYVVKPVSRFLYDQAFTIQKELAHCPFIRLPVDGNDANNALVYKHYTEDFLSFIQTGPVSKPQAKQILSDVLKGIAACHRQNWVHADIKPNNVMISHTSNSHGGREIRGVALADAEDAAKLQEGEGIFAQVGNVLWRSPEAQVGVRVGKASDIWSFGVTAVYGITKLVIFAYDELPNGVEPEVEVLANMLSYFGPLPSGLIEHVKDTPWGMVLMNLDASFGKEEPRKPFSLWRDIDGVEPDDKKFFMRVLKLDPAFRPTAEELLKDPWFSSP